MSTNSKRITLLSRFKIIKAIPERWGNRIVTSVGDEGFVGVHDKLNHKQLYVWPAGEMLKNPNAPRSVLHSRDATLTYKDRIEYSEPYTLEEALQSNCSRLAQTGKIVHLSNLLKGNQPFVFRLTRHHGVGNDARWFTITEITSQLRGVCVTDNPGYNRQMFGVEHIDWSTLRLLSMEEALLSSDKTTRHRVTNPRKIIYEKVAATSSDKFHETKKELKALAVSLESLYEGCGTSHLKKVADKILYKRLVKETLDKRGWSECQSFITRLTDEWDQIKDELNKAIVGQASKDSAN